MTGSPQIEISAGFHTRRFLLFGTGLHMYALPTDEVMEVVLFPRITSVPQSPASLLGVTNIRGTVVPVASLQGLLGRRDAVEQSGRAIILGGKAPVALVVDHVAHVATVKVQQIETGQAMLAAEPGELLRGAFPAATQSGMAKILDVQALLNAAFAQRSSTKARSVSAASQVVRQVVAEAEDEQLLVSFDISGQEYACDLDCVIEIVSLPRKFITLPQSEALVLGVTSFRQSLLPLLSLRGLLGFEVTIEAAKRPKVIVTAVNGIYVGLVVDDIRAMLRAKRQLIAPTPALLTARAGGEARVSAIYRAEGGRRLISILSPKSLFREDVMQRLSASIEPLGQDIVAHVQENLVQLQFIVFRLGDEEYCLTVEAVDEVTRLPEKITRIPKTPKFLEGVVNLRGDVVPVIDQRRRFDLPKFDGDRRRQRLVILRSERHRAALIVDSVSELLRVPRGDIERPPDLADDGTNLIQGVINQVTTGRMIMVLDPNELITQAERGLLDKFEPAREKGAV